MLYYCLAIKFIENISFSAFQNLVFLSRNSDQGASIISHGFVLYGTIFLGLINPVGGLLLYAFEGLDYIRHCCCRPRSYEWLNLGIRRPNLDSTPAKMGRATWYPPTWSGLEEDISMAPFTDSEVEPVGRLPPKST